MRKTSGADQAPETQTPPAEDQAAPAPATIEHPAEGGSYVRDPETGKLTKQKD